MASFRDTHENLERRAKFRKLCETIEALSAKEMRLLIPIEEQMGHALRRWPDDVRTKMLSGRLDFKGRFSVYLFVAGNRCPPELFVDWVIGRKMLRWEQSATHLASIIKAHQTGKLEADEKTYWDMTEKCVLTIPTPSFSMETEDTTMSAGADFWQRAIEKLEQHASVLPREPKSL